MAGQTPDIALLFWVVSKLGYGYEHIFEGLKTVLDSSEMSGQSLEVATLRFLVDTATDIKCPRLENADCYTADEFWRRLLGISTGTDD